MAGVEKCLQLKKRRPRTVCLVLRVSTPHAMARHMHQYGSTREDFAHISVVTREWATLNPRAIMHSKETHPFGGPITTEVVLNSPMIAWPMTLLNCCLVTDHGGAVIVARDEVARSLSTNPVWILGAGEAMGHSNMVEMEDFTATSAAQSSKRAYEMAGLGPDDMGMAMIYDSFTITAAITAEMLGLAPRGQGYRLWKDGDAAPGGRLPINTNGGGLSFNHSGMYGMQLLVEAYRQLSRTAEDGVNTASPVNKPEQRPVLSTALEGRFQRPGRWSWLLTKRASLVGETESPESLYGQSGGAGHSVFRYVSVAQLCKSG